MIDKLRQSISLFILLIAIVAVIFTCVIPVCAATNPTTVQWGSGSPATQYQVFYNVLETGDWLILAESYIITMDNTASTVAFSFALLNISGNTTLVSTPLWSYGDRPVSLYISADDVATLGLAVGSAYILRLGGNPTIFPSSVNNTIMATLTADDYSNQGTATDDLNPLKVFCINMATHMQLADGVSTYMIYARGEYYLTSTGTSLFLQGVPDLDTMCPNLFQTVVNPINAPDISSNTSYSDNMSIANMFGSTAEMGITNLTAWFGLPNTAGARALLLIGIGAILLFILSKRIPDRSMLLVFGVLFFSFAVWIGIASWMMLVVIAIIVSILFFYYLWSRGVL